MPNPPRIDYAPIMRHLERVGGINELVSHAGLDLERGVGGRIRSNHYASVLKGTATIYHIDELCCLVLHCHPTMIYGNEWYAPRKNRVIAGDIIEKVRALNGMGSPQRVARECGVSATTVRRVWGRTS